MWPQHSLGSRLDAEVWICDILSGIVAKGGGKGGGASPPPAVDPVALAQAQTQSNIETAKNQAQLNNVNTFSPLGSTQFQFDPNTGQYTLNQNISPQLQGTFNNQALASGEQSRLLPSALDTASNFGGVGGQALSNAQGSFPGETGAGVGLGTPLQSAVDLYHTVNLQSGLPTDFANQVQKAQDAAYRSQTQYLDPQFSQARSDLAQQLADQGLAVGGAAYDRATGNLGRQQQAAYQSAQDAATAAGDTEQARLFQEGLGAGEFYNQGQLAGANFTNQAALETGQFKNQAQQQAVQQEQQRFQNPLGWYQGISGVGNQDFGTALSGLIGLQPNFGWAGNLPTFGGSPTTVSPSNVVGAQQAATQAANARFNAANTNFNQFTNGLGSLGSVLNGGSLNNFGSGGLLGSIFGGGASTGSVAGLASAASPITGLSAADLGGAFGIDSLAFAPFF